MNKKFKKSDKGITLVALIITIIMLVILAVVTINSVKGDGIIAKAKNAADKYKNSQAEEQEEIQKAEFELSKLLGKTDENNLGNFDENDYIVALIKNGEYVNNKFIIVRDGEGTDLFRNVTAVNISVQTLEGRKRKNMGKI